VDRGLAVLTSGALRTQQINQGRHRRAGSRPAMVPIIGAEHVIDGGSLPVV
jgi:hypothetical protein